MFCWLYLFFVTGELSALYKTILTTSWVGGSGDYIFVTRSFHYSNETVLVFDKLKNVHPCLVILPCKFVYNIYS